MEDAWVWKDHKTLYVEFMGTVPPEWKVGNGEQMNIKNILDWANVWNQKGDGKIPRFEEAKGRPSEIRIQFNGKIMSCATCLSFMMQIVRLVSCTIIALRICSTTIELTLVQV